MHKKIATILCISSFVILSCTSKKEECELQSNHLIPATASITYEQTMVVPQEYFFLKGINFENFCKELREKTVSGKITAYYPMSDIKLSKADIQSRFADSVYKKGELKHLLFEEDWHLDTAQFVMRKKVLSYSLVREFVNTRRNDENGLTKSLIAKYVFANNEEKDISDLDLLEKDVTYDMMLENPDNPEWTTGIQIKHAVKIIIDKALQGKTPLYSFMNRDNKAKLALEEVKKSLGEGIDYNFTLNEETEEMDSVAFEKSIDYSEIVGLAFIEDWYIDKKTMQIYKVVKAIAPIRKYWKMFGENVPEQVQTIPFMMYFSDYSPKK